MTCRVGGSVGPDARSNRAANRVGAVVLILSLGAGPATSQSAEPMRFDFSWAGTRACSAGAKSPAMAVSGIPTGTVRLNFTLQTESGSEHFGIGFVDYRGQALVPTGELDVRMPCRSATYTWTLTATDRNGAILAGAVRTGPFP